MQFDEVEIQCPHCGEPLSAPVDPSQGVDQEFIEDCAVCCKAILIRMNLSDDEPVVEVLQG